MDRNESFLDVAQTEQRTSDSYADIQGLSKGANVNMSKFNKSKGADKYAKIF